MRFDTLGQRNAGVISRLLVHHHTRHTRHTRAGTRRGLKKTTMIQAQPEQVAALAASSRHERNWPLAVLYLLSLSLLGYLLYYGWDYYLTPLIERPRHELYWSLKPGGSLGRLYGIIGIGLMTLMMGYSVRKRVRALRRALPLRVWLDYHIFCGVIGPLFIVLHSSLKVTGIVALSFWSMVVVASSGVIGRYLYLQIPRRRSGAEMTLAEVNAMSEQLNGQLISHYGVSEKAIQRIDQLASLSVDSEAGLVKILAGLPLASARLRWRVKGLTRRMSSTHRDEVERVLTDRAMLSRRILLWARLQELFHYWHVLHKPFALVMYIFAAVHIGVAIATGYGFR